MASGIECIAVVELLEEFMWQPLMWVPLHIGWLEGDIVNKHVEVSMRKSYDFEATVHMSAEFGVQQFSWQLYHSWGWCRKLTTFFVWHIIFLYLYIKIEDRGFCMDKFNIALLKILEMVENYTSI
jgi:hypothetical protein